MHLAAADEIAGVESLLRAHRFWRSRGQRIDLVFLDLKSGGYARPLRDRLAVAIEDGGGTDWVGRPAGIHIVGMETCDAGDRILLRSVASVVLDGTGENVRDRVRAIRRPPAQLPPFVPVISTPLGRRENVPVQLSSDLILFNGIGGFTRDGREYVIRVRRDRPTPSPWINVLANPGFGCIVSESGLGCTWSASSSENRLTPWRNDPISDRPAEAIYLRDEETADVWSPTPLPCGTGAPYEVRHGAGYTSFKHHSHGLRQRLTVFCAPDAPVKIVRLRLENGQRCPRRITATYYAEWVLGRDRDSSAQFVIPEYDAAHQVMLVRNQFAEPFAGRVAFLTASETPHGITSDRTEFLGQNGDPARPAALDRIGLSGMVGPGPDPCGAWMLHVDLAPGETKVYAANAPYLSDSPLQAWQRAAGDLAFLTGEANMAHSLANLEHHHFKYPNFRRPGDVHVHFFGTATLSFADGIQTRDGDRFEISLPEFGRPLRNPLRFESGRRATVVKAL